MIGSFPTTDWNRQSAKNETIHGPRQSKKTPREATSSDLPTKHRIRSSLPEIIAPRAIPNLATHPIGIQVPSQQKKHCGVPIGHGTTCLLPHPSSGLSWASFAWRRSRELHVQSSSPPQPLTPRHLGSRYRASPVSLPKRWVSTAGPDPVSFACSLSLFGFAPLRAFPSSWSQRRPSTPPRPSNGLRTDNIERRLRGREVKTGEVNSAPQAA